MMHFHPDDVLLLVRDQQATIRRDAGASRLRRDDRQTRRRQHHRHPEVPDT